MGQGTADAKTDGCEAVVLEGDQFGPRTVLPQAAQETCSQALADVTREQGQAASLSMPVPRVTYWSRWVEQASPSNYSVLEASDCVVSQASTRITCRTAPGVGDELVWQVEIDGQASQVLQAMTNYHPPVITGYEGPGSAMARTEGNQPVRIEGKHFGPIGTTVQRAVYTR